MSTADAAEIARIIMLPTLRAAAVHDRDDCIAVYALVGDSPDPDTWTELWLADFPDHAAALDFATTFGRVTLEHRAGLI